jgi:hypothetical protein
MARRWHRSPGTATARRRRPCSTPCSATGGHFHTLIPDGVFVLAGTAPWYRRPGHARCGITASSRPT